MLLAGGMTIACGSEAPTDKKTAKPAASTTTSGAGGKVHVVSQKDKQFLPGDLNIKVGDTVNFRNDDKVFHNVYSFSEARLFDLGSYASGQAKKVVFDKEGKVVVECAIHPKMRMTINVTK